MFKTLTLFLFSLLLPVVANASIIDLGKITRDTSTGLDWLDLTETLGGTVLESDKYIGEGAEYENWRLSTIEEVQLLFKNFGLVKGTYGGLPVPGIQYPKFIDAVTMIGNIGNSSQNYDYAFFGFTGSMNDVGDYKTAGMFHLIGKDYVVAQFEGAAAPKNYINPSRGLFLVRESPSQVPVPASIWLFSSALIGLFSLKRKS